MREDITNTIAIKTSNQCIFQTGNLFTHKSETEFEYKRRELTRIANGKNYNNMNNPGGTIENYAFFSSDEIATPFEFSLKPKLRFENQRLNTKSSDPTSSITGTNHDGTTYYYSRYSGGVEAKCKLKEAFTFFGDLFYSNKFLLFKNFDINYSVSEANKGNNAVNMEIGISFDNSKQTTNDHKIKAKLILFDNDINESLIENINKITVKGVELELSYANPSFMQTLPQAGCVVNNLEQQ